MRPGCIHLDVIRGHPSRRPLRGLLRMRSVGLSVGEDQWVRKQSQSLPTKRKRPWGAGVSVVNLGGSWGLNYPRGTLGGYKEPREFREFSFTVRQCCLNS